MVLSGFLVSAEDFVNALRRVVLPLPGSPIIPISISDYLTP